MPLKKKKKSLHTWWTHTHTRRSPCTVCYPPFPTFLTLCVSRQISCTCSLTLSKHLFSFSQPWLCGKICTWFDHGTTHQRLGFPLPCDVYGLHLCTVRDFFISDHFHMGPMSFSISFFSLIVCLLSSCHLSSLSASAFLLPDLH